MEGATLVQIVTIIAAAIVSVVTLIVRADVNSLKTEIRGLRETVASAHALILRQNEIIQTLAGEKIDPIERMPPIIIKDEPYQAMPPYRSK